LSSNARLRRNHWTVIVNNNRTRTRIVKKRNYSVVADGLRSQRETVAVIIYRNVRIRLRPPQRTGAHADMTIRVKRLIELRETDFRRNKSNTRKIRSYGSRVHYLHPLLPNRDGAIPVGTIFRYSKRRS